MTFAQAPFLPQIVGIVNVTPDSFSDGGKYLTAQEAIKKAYNLAEEGADIIDIGAESTGPNSKPISAEEEWRRLEPVLKVVARDLTISVDTYKAETASRALQLGSNFINDVSALRADRSMAKVIADAGCKLVLMHSKEVDGKPHVSGSDRVYDDVVKEITEFFLQRVQYCLENGIKRENIILDPGIGLFLSKDESYSWQVLSRIAEFRTLNLPIFIGVSRKGFLRNAEKSSASDRDPVSALIGVHLACSGVSYIRTHNVKLTKEFLATWNKLTVTNQ